MGQGVANAWRSPRGRPRRGLTTRKFRGSITQRLIWLSTLRGDGRPSPRQTRFRLLARLCRTGLVTRRISMKGFTFEMILLSRASWRKVKLRYLFFRAGPDRDRRSDGWPFAFHATGAARIRRERAMQAGRSVGGPAGSGPRMEKPGVYGRSRYSLCPGWFFPKK
jgi:hypothetical protein